MKIQILTDKDSWFYNNKDKTPKKYKKYLANNFINNHKRLKKNYDITIIISYYKIIPKKFLSFSKFNLVVHESNLPKGRGMSPLYWQILKGKENIVFTLFECSKNMDEGKFYFKKQFKFEASLLFEEIKNKQLKYAFQMVDLFIKKYSRNKNIKNKVQIGEASYFPKIQPSFSEIDINKSIKSQFNKLRTRDNKNYPAYFYYKKRKYIIKIS